MQSRLVLRAGLSTEGAKVDTCCAVHALQGARKLGRTVGVWPGVHQQGTNFDSKPWCLVLHGAACSYMFTTSYSVG